MDAREAIERELTVLRSRVSDLQRELGTLRVAKECVPVDGGAAGLSPSLAEREALLAEAELIAGLGTWVWTPAEDLVHWSPGLFRLLGYDPDRDRSSSEAFFARVHPDDLDRVRATSERGVATGIAEQVDYRLLLPGGEVRHVTMSGSMVFDADGTLARVVGTVLDLTERRRLDLSRTEYHKLEALGRLAASVAHDFNNTLMVVRGNLELMRLPGGEALGELLGAIDSARSLTAQLLTFSKHAPLSRATVDLNVLVARTVGLLGRMLREHLTLRLTVGPAPAWVDVDESAIEQALVNLVLNARDAMPDGGTVEVSVRPVRRAGEGRVALAVRDEGTGLDEATRERLFEPFFTTRADAGGTGLGLAIVHGAVRQHGGDVEVESEPGRGTCITLTFPATGAATPREEAPRLGVEAGAALRVLVVDDQVMVASVTARMVEALGHEATVATSRADALEAAGEAIDVILCDVIMPGVRGPQLVAELAAAAPAGPPAVVFMTGNSADLLGDSREALLLPKPFTLEQLEAVLRRAAT